MNVIEAPDYSFKDDNQPSVFLAGGIANCPDWQKEVIERLVDCDALALNPKRENFPMDDPNAAKEQITWEFKALESADVFSMWFCAGESDQPICQYELGRHLALRSTETDYNRVVTNDLGRVVIGVEKGYKREQNVRIQTELICPELASRISSDLGEHSENIRKAINGCKEKQYKQLAEQLI